jgi:molybdopterin-biosynthesis enzyme MoeA-like protein
MLDALTGTLEGGRPVVSVTIGGMVPESEVADLLSETERAHQGIAIGSYPFFREGRVGANFVIRSEDLGRAQAVADQLQASLESAGYLVVPGGI